MSASCAVVLQRLQQHWGGGSLCPPLFGHGGDGATCFHFGFIFPPRVDLIRVFCPVCYRDITKSRQCCCSNRPSCCQGGLFHWTGLCCLTGLWDASFFRFDRFQPIGSTSQTSGNRDGGTLCTAPRIIGWVVSTASWAVHCRMRADSSDGSAGDYLTSVSCCVVVPRADAAHHLGVGATEFCVAPS